MRNLDDILVGFLIFFTIDRLVRLFTTTVVEPWAHQKTSDEHKVEGIKLGVEAGLLIFSLILVFKFRRNLNSLSNLLNK
jgi:hypothetical protein